MRKVLPEEMTVWNLKDPTKPERVGYVRLIRGSTNGSFSYDKSWLENGYPLCPNMPLSQKEFLPSQDFNLPFALDDAMPDRWGQNMIMYLDRPARLSAIDYLYYAGDSRFGALGVSLSKSHYEPCKTHPLPGADSIEEASCIIDRILEKLPVNERERLLMASSRSMGGARPKMLIRDNGKEWIAKFPRGDFVDTSLIEHATMRLAESAGIESAKTRALPAGVGHVTLIERFDRKGGKRLHCISAKTLVAKRDEDGAFSYRMIADAIRRYGNPDNIELECAQMFRRMVFNIMMDNTDDHEKNHAFIHSDDGYWGISPAYDVVPQMNSLCHQALLVGHYGSEATRENALSIHDAFLLSMSDAQAEFDRVANAVSKWEDAFKACGVSDYDIDYLKDHLDSEEKAGLRQTGHNESSQALPGAKP